MSVKFSVNFDESKFMCPDGMWTHLAPIFAGEYDIPLHGRDFVILDLGANCGAFSVWAQIRWPDSQIWAYEPHPKTFKILQKNVQPNKKMITVNKAVGEVGKLGFRILHDGKHNCGEMTLCADFITNRTTGVHVEMFDPLNLPEADILKMDIEGSEIEVLPKLIEAGRKYKAILFEYHGEWIRRELDRILVDYNLVKAEVHHIMGRGTVCYMHKDVLPCDF